MNTYKAQFFFLFLISTIYSEAQNLPSLMTKRNINSTFSIVAYDEATQEWGIAVAANNIHVGSSTIYIEPGVGAFSVIGDTEPRYGIEGLKSLKAGRSVEQAITEIRDKDDRSYYRQVSGVDANGDVFAFTGNSLKYWKGEASEIIGDQFVVMGNQLAPEVLSVMFSTYEDSKGTLATRLLESLVAGQQVGGQISGKQSAALVVKGTNNEWYNQIDLRVDNSQHPIKELQTLMDYHYGRIVLNQARYADSFDLTDWESAMSMLSNLGRELEVIELAQELIGQGIESSCSNFLLGRSYYFEKEQVQALKYLNRAVSMDSENVEALELLKRIDPE